MRLQKAGVTEHTSSDKEVLPSPRKKYWPYKPFVSNCEFSFQSQSSSWLVNFVNSFFISFQLSSIFLNLTAWPVSSTVHTGCALENTNRKSLNQVFLKIFEPTSDFHKKCLFFDIYWDIFLASHSVQTVCEPKFFINISLIKGLFPLNKPLASSASFSVLFPSYWSM